MIHKKDAMIALGEAQAALELIAAPKRGDGTYNRDRFACEQLAVETLLKIRAILQGPKEPSAESPPPSKEKQEPLGAGPFVVYSDGGCKGNPGPAGWGVVIVEEGEVRVAKGGFIGKATNQVAELEAAIQGLALIPRGATVELVSDSQYTLKGLVEWRSGWERRGWTNSQGEPVANQSHWKRLYAEADRLKVKTRWVKGHNGDRLNELCDELAGTAIKDGLLEI